MSIASENACARPRKVSALQAPRTSIPSLSAAGRRSSKESGVGASQIQPLSYSETDAGAPALDSSEMNWMSCQPWRPAKLVKLGSEVFKRCRWRDDRQISLGGD